MKTSKLINILLVLALLMVLVPVMAVGAGSANKVAICHRTGNGSFHLINVSVNALSAHLGHGDGQPGLSVPEMEGYTFDGNCKIVEDVPADDDLPDGGDAGGGGF